MEECDDISLEQVRGFVAEAQEGFLALTPRTPKDRYDLDLALGVAERCLDLLDDPPPHMTDREIMESVLAKFLLAQEYFAP